MKLQPIVDRLKDRGLARVYGALEMAGLKERPGRLPAYFVVRDSWTAGANRLDGAHDQKVAELFGVVILLEAAGMREETIDDSLHDEEQRVIDALAAWTHPNATSACEAAGGRLVSVDRHTLGWMVSFRLGRHIRKAG
ncbi:MAG: hypothetical protein QOI38_3127 [Sphingomonadales bacterium]|jgi:hypothetical protein|nr:hypothetical protein [Sphingomonadales bacterium]